MVAHNCHPRKQKLMYHYREREQCTANLSFSMALISVAASPNKAKKHKDEINTILKITIIVLSLVSMAERHQKMVTQILYF